MAKNIINHPLIKRSGDLVTPREKTRAGFIKMALEKNYLAVPYIDDAKTLRLLAREAKSPNDLLTLNDVYAGLLTASGLSDKSLNHLTKEDEKIAIQGLIDKFLIPAGDEFVDELVFRFLLTKGDALGGKARNLAGTIGERKFLRTLLSFFNVAGVEYYWKDSESETWLIKPEDDTDIEKRIKALSWSNENGNRLLVMNTTVPLVKKNVDALLMNGTKEELRKGKTSIIYSPEKYLALGELKGGFDPAGADEHWKTANSALSRIRTSFKTKRLKPGTFFVGAAIEASMAQEIFADLRSGNLTNAANLTHDEQMLHLCEWVISF